MPLTNEQQQSFETHYKEMSPKLMRFGRNSGLSNEDCEDCIQQTFLKIFNKWAICHHKNIEAWTYKIFTNTMKDIFRKNNASVQLNNEEIIRDCGSNSDFIFRDFITKCVSNLPARQKQVITERYLNECSYQSMAATMNLSPKAIASAIFYGLKNLVKML